MKNLNVAINERGELLKLNRLSRKQVKLLVGHKLRIFTVNNKGGEN